MSFRCVVIDDEKLARQKLIRLLDGIDDFEVVAEAADANEAVAVIDREKPDLCFLDVEMPEGTGFDVLRRVAAIPNVIFTTAYDQYAVEAFEVRSLDYLLKPFGKKRLAEALDRARNLLRKPDDTNARVIELLESLESARGGSKAGDPAAGDASSTPDADAGASGGTAAAGGSSPGRITARRGSKIVVLAPDEILWFEAEETLVFACSKRGRLLVERTLTDLEASMGDDFFRSHRGYLVRLDQVAEILPCDAGTFEIVPRAAPDVRIPLSRRQARRLRELIPW